VNKGICSRCRKRKTCKYTRPEGWVLECEEFEEETETPSDGQQEKEEQESAREPEKNLPK
jgi:ssDNA-binding Zn-finger/Zn-ribbon topoisomerase 1